MAAPSTSPTEPRNGLEGEAMKITKQGTSVVFAVALAFSSVLSTDASAVALLDANGVVGGAGGYGTQLMFPNDDGSSAAQSVLFPINFFGQMPTQYFVNNNGNITFNGPVSTFTPQAFPVAAQPMIAPFWGDVDTRCGACGTVSGAAPNANTLIITWNNVGYYSSHSNKINDFQLVLRNRADTGAGNFDVDFRYRQLQWTTGDASGGSNGLGGTPAQAGYDAGNNTNFFVLPGSRTADVLQLANTSNVGSDTPGLWTFAIRNGELPGQSPSNPLMPVVEDGSFNFEFAVPSPTTRIFIDPFIAVGYDYVVNSGPNMQTVVLPTVPGDIDGYDLYGGLLFDVFLAHVNPGDIFDFGPGGVSRFAVRDIDIAANLDPADAAAFVTGLTFVSAGIVDMSQTPVSVFVNGSAVPIPGTLYLLALGLLAIGGVARTRRVR